jgi:hypothetical protein
LGKGGGNGGITNPVPLLGKGGGNGGITNPVPAGPPRGPIVDTGPPLTLAKSNVGTSIFDSTFPFPASTTTEWIWFPVSTTRTIYTKNPLSGWRVDEIAVELLPTALKAAVVASFIPVFICDLNACIIVGNVGIEPVQFRSIIEASGKEVALLRDWIWRLWEFELVNRGGFIDVGPAVGGTLFEVRTIESAFALSKLKFFWADIPSMRNNDIE